MNRAVLTILALVLSGIALWAVTRDSPSIFVEDAVAQVDGDTLAIRFTLNNSGHPDRLRAARSGLAETATIVAPDSGGDSVPIPGHHAAVFSTDGAFIRLSGVEGAFSEGRLVPVMLDLERAGTVAFKARIEAPVRALHRIHGQTMIPVAEGEPTPALGIAATTDPEGGWRLRLETENFRFAEDLVDGPHAPGTGHAHLYVGSVKLGRLYAPGAHIPPLPPGRHTVRVTLNTNDHRLYAVEGEPISATVEIVAK